MPLTEAGIYAAALRLIDQDGAEALTMRKLATALDANPMSLYHHVSNKEAVLRGVTRTVGAQFRTVALENAPWQERIRLLAADFRTLAHRHPGLMAYSFSHQPDFIQPDDPFWTALTAIVAAAGVPQPEVPEIAALIVAVVIGALTAELNGSLHQWANLKPPGPDSGEERPTDAAPRPTGAGPEGPDQDHMFRLVMNTLIAGLESRLTADDDGRDVGRR
ncbi:TetR family transcriptional regulator [Streptomyces dangxiongensis]|uniref:TetR family transcriptional regulator n=1 Tax=Streptomyces dangxiongensis TaxID=1442032 RepID=UPI001F08B6F1|nr:TetR family transcriptional regulator [Streptomyces dangxiongensis]